VVDFQTYQQLHSSSGNFKMLYPSIDAQDVERIGPEIMASNDPPAAPDIYVFPNTIPGYDLRSKKWGKCAVYKFYRTQRSDDS
jgi:hypothetical protein